MLLLLTITGVAVLYILFDVNYFIRLFLSLLWTQFCQKEISVFDTATTYGVCWLTDLDMCPHMNNARYLRELDFARYNFYQRAGLFKQMLRKRKLLLQSASSIRHRKPISIFCVFKINTKLLYFEKKCVYLKQEFISLFDGVLRAVVLSRQSIRIGNIDEIFQELTKPEEKPTLPEEIRIWIQCIDCSNKSSTFTYDNTASHL